MTRDIMKLWRMLASKAYTQAQYIIRILSAVGSVSTAVAQSHLSLRCLCIASSHSVCTDYPDVGACSAILNEDIKVKSDASVVSLDETGIAFSDGSHADADVIVYCTGFKHDTREIIANIVGEEHALQLEPVWGVDKEGEIRGAYRSSGHDHIWHTGGGFLFMRYYGQFLALQIVAVLAGVRPEPVRA